MVELSDVEKLENAKRGYLGAHEESWIERAPISFEAMLLAPSVVALALLSIVPLVVLIWLSFHDNVLSPTLPAEFVGLDNYGKLLGEKQRFSWYVTTLYVGGNLTLQVLLGVTIAVALDRAKYFSDLVTTAILMPMLIAPVIAGFLWRFLLNPSFGLYAYLLHQVGLFTQTPVLANPTSALAAVILMDTWQWTPLVVVIVLAALKSIPQQLYEAARVDGASVLTEFRYIELPLLKPAIVIALLLRSMDLMRFFTKIFITTNGGPASGTKIVGFYVYEQTLRFNNLGVGSALGIAMLVVTVLLGLFFVETIQGGAVDE